MEKEVSRLISSFRRAEKEAVASLGDIRDPALDTVAQDGRTLRQVLFGLSDYYRECTEQLRWTKWDQGIQRSEVKQALVELQLLRARFVAYLTDLRDEQLDVASTTGNTTPRGCSARDVVVRVLDEERKNMKLIRKHLGR